MEIYTVRSGNVEEGAIVGRFIVKSAGVEIPAIIVGEPGRGRQQGVLPVELSEAQQTEWEQSNTVRLMEATLATTKTGKPKLLVTDNSLSDEIICVFLTKIGFRGGNDHTGDRTGEKEHQELTFAPFPGGVIAQGTIAQGDAGRMGAGTQLVAVMPKGVVFRTAYNGRLYGEPSAHYYLWDGISLIGLTWEQRCCTELF